MTMRIRQHGWPRIFSLILLSTVALLPSGYMEMKTESSEKGLTKEKIFLTTNLLSIVFVMQIYLSN